MKKSILLKAVLVVFCALFYLSGTISVASETASLPLLTGQGMYLYSQNKLDKSLTVWNKIISIDPSNKTAIEYIEKISVGKNRKFLVTTESLEELNKRPTSYDSKLIETKQNEDAAFEYFEKANFDEAVGKWRKIIELYPKNTNYLSYLALTLFRQGKFDQSLSQWEKVLLIDPENTQAIAYIKILSNSSYNELRKIESTIRLPERKSKEASIDRVAPFEYRGFEATIRFDGYFKNRTIIDESTVHLGETLKIKNSLYGKPLNLSVSNDLWRSHGDTISGVGTWGPEDYELFYRPRLHSLEYFGDKLQILVGDISSNFVLSENSNRHIYPGVDYRGINVILKTEKLRTKVLWGFIPFFEPRKTVNGAPRTAIFNRIVDSNDDILFSRNYIHPREILAVDMQYEFHPRYVVGAFFSHSDDHSELHKISRLFPLSENYIVGFNQSITLFPGPTVRKEIIFPTLEKKEPIANVKKVFSFLKQNFRWYLYHEFNYSWLFSKVDKTVPIYSDDGNLSKNINLNGFATYVRSDMTLPRFYSELIYERIEPNFRNLGGFTYAQTVTYDREYLKSLTYFYPKDNLNFSLNMSKLLSDLENDRLIPKKDWKTAKFNMKWLPGGILPDISFDVVTENYKNSSMLVEHASRDWWLNSYSVGLYKNILDWDIHSIYKLTVHDDDENNFNQIYNNFFSVELFKTLSPGVDFSFGNFFTNVNVNRPVPYYGFDRDYNHTDVTFDFSLWDTASLSLFYSYLHDMDNFQEVGNENRKSRTHSMSATFGWPIYIRDFLDHQLDIYPYITCLVNDSNRRKFDNTIIEPSLKIKYKFNTKNYFQIQSSYRHDTGFEDEFKFYSYFTFALDKDSKYKSDANRLAKLKKYINRKRRYTVGYNDQLSVELINKTDKKTIQEQTFTVNKNGTITPKDCDPLFVIGMTQEEIETVLSKKYADKNIEIHVSSFGAMNDKITVTGEVSKPGIYPITGDLTVFEAIILAGGINNTRADKKKIKITRSSTHEVFYMDLNKYVTNKNIKQNIQLQSGDIISIPKNTIASFTKLFRK